MSKIETLRIPEQKASIIDVKEPPNIGRLLWSSAYGDPQEIQNIIEESRVTEPSYLAYELVSEGKRAGLLVGQVYNGTKLLPYTGLEPYLVGSGISLKDFPRVIASMTIPVKLSIDKDICSRIYHKVLNGETSDPKAVSDLSAIYGASLARFRALGDSDNSGFRSETYANLRSVPKISYKIGIGIKGPSLTQEIKVLETNTDTLPVTNVNFNNFEDAAYRFSAKLGAFAGHPVVREVVRRLY